MSAMAILVSIVSLAGILMPDLYAADLPAWQVQSKGQDIIDLLVIVPLLLLSVYTLSIRHYLATPLSMGVSPYLAYTFTIYCFDVHFNPLFLLYCTILGVSFYNSLYMLLNHYSKYKDVTWKRRPVFYVTASYFIIIAILFYLLWLADIVPAITSRNVPRSLIDAGLFTNGVQVLDLAVFLPAVLLVAIKLFHGQGPGILLTPAILLFFILMDITVGFLAWYMAANEPGEGNTVMIAMSILAVISGSLLFWFIKETELLP